MFSPEEVFPLVKNEIDSFLKKDELINFSIDELKLQLKESLKKEDYRKAAELKKEINNKKGA